MLDLLTRVVVPPYKMRRAPSKTVAIVVPLSGRPRLLPEEEISLRHLLHFLGNHNKYFVAAKGTPVPCEDFKVVTFPNKFFGSVAAHNRLLMWPGFYRAFDDYKYILMYHLDSLVLSNQILRWCQADFDYIGAPWLPCPDTPWVTEARVGNGGFTLMNVQSVLKVLQNRYRSEPATFWSDLLVRNHARLFSLFRLIKWLEGYFPKSRSINRPLEDLRKTEDPGVNGVNNDYFWSFQATKYSPEFRVASVDEGLRFAFEAAPRRCLELTHGQIPFGCHAWTKFDRGFWKPYLLPPGVIAGSLNETSNGAVSRVERT